ncbi:hypothetical protein CRI94_07405 [Longibacter salinarum]|uniref:Uncharacterized protein n=1 Tax=Longibacter salinarum TaxID=1850348 RepID=A0A2A8CZ72_9BACT|nr:hypothetical protein [Longibacter salinarum]PEN13877.1 hypothetical protein CRI94_07405 [Longibacter salinarum]
MLHAPTVADDTVRRYYYIYDSRTVRTLVMDRVTGDEFRWEEDVRLPLLEHMVARRSERYLRRFALWCARQVMPHDVRAQTEEAGHGDTPTDIARYLIAAVQGDLDSGGITACRDEARQTTVDAVVHAATIGLSQMNPEAARLLSAQSCTHPDATQAAMDAAHMAERYAEFVAFRRREEHHDPSRVPTPGEAVRNMRQRQIDAILDHLIEDLG